VLASWVPVRPVTVVALYLQFYCGSRVLLNSPRVRCTRSWGVLHQSHGHRASACGGANGHFQHRWDVGGRRRGHSDRLVAETWGALAGWWMDLGLRVSRRPLCTGNHSVRIEREGRDHLSLDAWRGGAACCVLHTRSSVRLHESGLIYIHVLSIVHATSAALHGPVPCAPCVSAQRESRTPCPSGR